MLACCPRGCRPTPASPRDLPGLQHGPRGHLPPIASIRGRKSPPTCVAANAPCDGGSKPRAFRPAGTNTIAARRSTRIEASWISGGRPADQPWLRPNPRSPGLHEQGFNECLGWASWSSRRCSHTDGWVHETPRWKHRQVSGERLPSRAIRVSSNFPASHPMNSALRSRGVGRGATTSISTYSRFVQEVLSSSQRIRIMTGARPGRPMASR